MIFRSGGAGPPDLTDGHRMDTADRILTTAEELMQTRGYNGFSYQDLADAIGIRKPSLYHHFPSKADLGRAVIGAYRDRMRRVADQLDAVEGIDPVSALTLYLEPMLEIGRRPGAACLCGVLGSEFSAMPEEMQAEVTAFFEEHLDFLERLLARGRAEGAFRFEAEPRAVARLALSLIEGAMILKRSIDDRTLVGETVGTLTGLLRG